MLANLVGFVVGMTLVGTLLRWIEWIFPAKRDGRPIRTRMLSRQRWTDIAHIVLNEWVTQPIVKGVGLLVLIAFVVALGLPHEPSELAAAWLAGSRIARLPIGVQAGLAIVFVDLVGYWLHRALHYGRLWRLHAIHHSSIELDWLAGARNHPLQEIFSVVILMGSLLLAGFDPRVLVVTAPIRVFAVLLHANVPWGTGRLHYLIATPLFHRWHHADPSALPIERRGGVNFAAMFPLWDMLFGTFWVPREQPAAFGTGEAVPQRFLAQLWYPLRRRDKVS